MYPATNVSGEGGGMLGVWGEGRSISVPGSKRERRGVCAGYMGGEAEHQCPRQQT